jgi:glycosyltransferase involved in cell wall biosynthesis
MLRHHLPLFDEIIVNDGMSTDGTYEAITKIDPKIRVFREEWVAGGEGTIYARAKNSARERCTGDWCILLDADEFIPEWLFNDIRFHLMETEKLFIPLRHRQFYGNYFVENIRPERMNWFTIKYQIHRNLPEIRVWGDGSHVELPGCEDHSIFDEREFECHHFGFVMRPARLRQKWRVQTKLKSSAATWDWIPGFIYNILPHDWFDTDFINDLAIYDGPFVKAVRDDPDEFVRDGLRLLHYLKKGESLIFS